MLGLIDLVLAVNENYNRKLPKFILTCFAGNVGINTNSASEALAINGNIQMTGAILQPSDRRIKKVILY